MQFLGRVILLRSPCQKGSEQVIYMKLYITYWDECGKLPKLRKREKEPYVKVSQNFQLLSVYGDTRGFAFALECWDKTLVFVFFFTRNTVPICR